MVAIIACKSAVAQNKAIVLQDLWYNDLGNYNPRPFLDDVLIALEDKLSVKVILDKTSGPVALRPDSNWEARIRQQILQQKSSDDKYYIALSSELKFPAINVGKLLFKNPPRTSKLIFTFHVYNGNGAEVLGDTIVNRGCISRAIAPEQNNDSFYGSYQSFLDDMQCHLKVIKEQLQLKKLKPKLYLKAK